MSSKYEDMFHRSQNSITLLRLELLEYKKLLNELAEAIKFGDSSNIDAALIKAEKMISQNN